VAGIFIAIAAIAYLWYLILALIIAGLLVLLVWSVMVHAKRIQPGPAPVTEPWPELARGPKRTPEPAPAPVYWKKWDGTRKRTVAQDKDAWDRAFLDTAGRAEPLRKAQPAPPAPAPAQPAPAPAQPAPADVFATLRSRLQDLE
jgi:hypothetical protein